jgi:hypothetical protein
VGFKSELSANQRVVTKSLNFPKIRRYGLLGPKNDLVPIPGVNVMITNFCGFCGFSVKKLAFINPKL